MEHRGIKSPDQILAVVAFDICPMKVIIFTDGRQREVSPAEPEWGFEETETAKGERHDPGPPITKR